MSNKIEASQNHSNLSSKVEYREIPIRDIEFGKNSRLTLKSEALESLMQSIKEVGLLHPIGIAKKKSGKFETIYGNRRLLAVKKLGLSKIAAVIHDASSEAEYDIKNLSENMQRRNISLTEIGRYISLLLKEKMTTKEIAVRLGVSKSLIDSSYTAYTKVPLKYREDILVKMSGVESGSKENKISMSSARAILSSEKTLRLTAKQTRLLYEAAKNKKEFDSKKVNLYALAIKDGRKDFLKTVEKDKNIQLFFWVSKKEYRRLEMKYIKTGMFTAMTSIMRAILTGEINEKVRMVKR